MQGQELTSSSCATSSACRRSGGACAASRVRYLHRHQLSSLCYCDESANSLKLLTDNVKLNKAHKNTCRLAHTASDKRALDPYSNLATSALGATQAPHSGDRLTHTACKVALPLPPDAPTRSCAAAALYFGCPAAKPSHVRTCHSVATQLATLSQLKRSRGQRSAAPKAVRSVLVQVSLLLGHRMAFGHPQLAAGLRGKHVCLHCMYRMLLGSSSWSMPRAGTHQGARGRAAHRAAVSWQALGEIGVIEVQQKCSSRPTAAHQGASYGRSGPRKRRREPPVRNGRTKLYGTVAFRKLL